MKQIIVAIATLIVLTSATAPTWAPPVAITAANTFTAVTTTTTAASTPYTAGTFGGTALSVAYGITQLEIGASANKAINFAISFTLGATDSTFTIALTESTNLVTLTIRAILFTTATTYMGSLETTETFAGTTTVGGSGSGFRTSDPKAITSPIALTDGHNLVIVPFLRKIKMTKAAASDYFINTQAWRKNGTDFALTYSVKDTTNLTEAGSVILIFDTSVVAGKQSIIVDVAYGAIVNTTTTNIVSQAYFTAGGIIAGFTSFNFLGTDLPKFSMHVTTFAVTSTVATIKFLNVTLINVRERNCATGAYVFATSTCDVCPAGTYLVTVSTGLDYCAACMLPCLTCSDGTTCDTCPASYSGTPTGPQCLCTSAQYSNLTSSTCESCHSSCLTCSGGSSSQCLTCPVGLILNAGVCSCPVFGQYYYSAGHICNPCKSPCLTCITTADTCIDCVPGTYKIGGQCIKCPVGQYLDSASVCQNCSANCTSCVNSTRCSTCKSPAYLTGTFTCASCLSTQYWDGSACVACTAASCLTCLGSATTCTSCAVGKYLSATACLSCATGCANCTSLSWCLNCTAPLILSGGFCTSCAAGQYLDQGAGACLSCSASCATCLVFASNCTSCTPPKLLQGGSCVDCASGTVWSTTDAKCVPCAASCVTCSGSPTTCLTCPAFTTLSSGSCVSICSAGKYFEVLSGVCRDCPASCTACSNFTTCTACTSGLGLWMGQCNPCIAGQALNTTLGICQSCQPGCATCPNNTNCSTCMPGLVLLKGLCVACPDGKYFNPAIVDCSPCPSICANCNNNFTCTSCPAPLILVGIACVNCTSSQYYKSSTGTCDSCDASCLTCSVAATNCTSCTAPAVLTTTGICKSCTAGQYVNPAGAGTCVACTGSCATCLNASYCLTCSSGFNSAGVCQTCTAVQTLVGSTCTACNANCLTCSGTVTNCTTCGAGKGIQPDKTCATCNSSSYVNTATLLCTLCPLECLTCTDPKTCLTCVAPLALTGGACLPCRPNQYYDSATKTCINCATGCFACNSTTACAGCLSGYQLNSGVCIACTSTQFYNVSLMVCQSCPPSCLTCSSPAVCTSCSSPKILYGGSCILCPLGQFYNSGTSACLPCSSNCLSCADASTCYACNPPAVLDAGTCRTCPTGQYYKLTATVGCTACAGSCATCNSATTCTSCTGSLILVAGVCQTCPAGQYISSGTTCSSCDPTCLTCFGTATTCTSCVPTKGLAAGACTACTTAQYVHPIVGICVNCPTNCATCNNLAVCLTCSGSFVVSGGLCVACPSDSFYDATSKTCIGCSRNCLTCAGTSATCVTCPTGTVLATGKCVPCPPGQFQSAGACSACTSPCSECSGLATTCTACIATAFWDGTTCQTCGTATDFWDTSLATPACAACSPPCTNCRNATYCTTCATGNLAAGACQTCASNQFDLGGTCTACDPSCATCNTIATNCTSCPATKILNGSACVSCPAGTFYNAIQLGCAKCMPTCLTCATASTCASCDANKFRTLSGSVCVCATNSSENLMGQCISNTFCYPGFEWNGSGCQEICGDGKVFVLPCDDGNTLNGDGCSSTCQRENDFSCRGGSSANFTECSYSKPLQLQVQRIVKDLKANAVNFTILLSPPLKVLETVDFSTLITSNLPLKRIVATYKGAPQTTSGRVGAGPSGTLSVYAEYSTNIQNANCDLTIAPPTGTTGSFDMPASSISFAVVPENGGAYFYDDTVYQGSSRTTAILKIGLSLGVIALLISVVTNHVSGLEAMHLLQVLFFSFTMIGTVQPILAGASAFAGTNGYNALFNDQPALMDFGTSPSTPVLTTLGLGVRFLQNINIMLVFYVALGLAGLITYLISITVKSLEAKCDAITKLIFGDLLLMLGIFNALNAGFSLGVHLLWMNKPDVTPSNVQAGCVITILLSLAVNSLSVGLFFARPAFFSSTRKSLKEEKISQADPVIQLCFRFLLGFLFGILNSFTGASIVTMVIQILYLVYVIVMRPYNELFGNIRSIVINSISVFVLLVSIIYNFTIVDGQSTVGQGLLEAEIWIVLIVTALALALVLFNLVKYVRDILGDKVVPQNSVLEEGDTVGVKPEKHDEKVPSSTAHMII